jgi:hypothetical protein
MNAQHVVIALIVIGVLFVLGGRSTGLPGDIYYQGKQLGVSFPIVTSIVISIILSILFSLWGGGGK